MAECETVGEYITDANLKPEEDADLADYLQANTDERHREIVVRRIVKRLLEKALSGDSGESITVRGGLVGLKPTNHDTQTYCDVAKQLDEEWIGIKAYRVTEYPQSGGFGLSRDTPVNFDRVVITTVAGEIIRPDLECSPTVVQLYPPPKQSLRQPV